MPDLPRIPKRFTRPDLLMEVLCFIILLESWTYAVYTFNHLPTHVHVFYKFTNDLANKNAIWFFPLLATLTFIGISWISSFPHKFNYKETVTRINARKIYSKTLRKLRTIKLILVLICGIGVITFAYFAEQTPTESSSMLSILSSLILVLPILYLLYLVYFMRNNRI